MTTRYLPLALRAYAEAPAAKPMKARPPRPSPYSLVIDCETTTHLEQELRFGFYRVYNGLELEDEGAFSGFLQPHESKTLEDYCAKHGLTYMVLNEWVEKVFYEFGYRLHGQVVGFNLPFDLSRLAQRWAVSRGSMSGGWTFYLADDTAATPPLQIKSLSHHRAVIRFRSRWADRAPRSMRKRELPVRPYRGHFVDVHTFAHCLLGSSFTLSELCKTLGVKHGKLITKGHGKLTPAYLKYAERDPLATWECFLKLREQLRGSGLKVEPSSLYSEAGVAKAILRQMGVKPWRQLQPGFHPELLGIIWSTYYAGRSELHLRREHRPSVYLDFTSQYPAIAALMGLWRYLTATGIEVSEATDWARTVLERVTLDKLFNPDVWPHLNVLVQLQPDQDILPARGPYAGQGDSTIGENLVTSARPMWYTLAAAIASKLRTGKAPIVLKALRFRPGPLQAGLEPMQLFGCTVQPTEDLYRVLINHRHELREAGKEHEQLALKLAANSLAAGIFGEVNVTVEDPARLTIHSNGEQLRVTTTHREEPGLYYHPLLATFVTGGGRLLLAMLEAAAAEQDIDWLMCDTDSMVFESTDGYGPASLDLQERFEPLNPYNFGPFLKCEYQARFFGLSAKRYCLFEWDGSQPFFRKVSGHGLGFLASPVDPWPPCAEDLIDTSGREFKVVRNLETPGWQVEVWRRILQAHCHDTAPDYSVLPGFDETALMHYVVTRPAIEEWIALRPFTFMSILLGKSKYSGVFGWREIRPIAPFTRSPREAEALAVDRRTGKPLGADVDLLATYSEALADYHVHPESKFDGDPHARGFLPRVEVVPDGFAFIGKEANLADERSVFGSKDVEAEIVYATVATASTSWRQAFAGISLTDVCRVTGLSKGYVSRLLRGERELTDEIREKFRIAARELAS